MSNNKYLIETDIRKELSDDYHVFYITSWGYAADHLIGWLPKALNCHPDIFALLAHEGSRPKYFTERTRAERPALIPFTEFLNDMGMTYSLIGDCYSYRAGQMRELLNIERYSSIPVLNILRHPIVWLEYYVRWRSSNMRMREGATDPLAWEWKTSCHGYFDYLDLKKYEKDEIDVWASYQGMFQLNNVLGDISSIDKHVPIERIANDPAEFNGVIKYLSKDRVEYEQSILDKAYSMCHTLFRGETDIETEPEKLLESWPDWKIDAFRKLVSKETINIYNSYGYNLSKTLNKPLSLWFSRKKLQRSIFVSSLPKSGTWLIREILESITDLKSFEPDVEDKAPNYEDEMLIEFPKGTFFSWHSILTKRTVALLNGSQSKNIFLIRNIYDLILSMYNHLKNDVDANIGRSIKGNNYFDDKSVEQSLSLMISGFTTPELTWHGAEEIIKQMSSFLDYVEKSNALIIDYDHLVNNKKETIKKITKFLEVDISRSRIKSIIADTDKNTMRERLKKNNLDSHVTDERHKLNRDQYSQYHKHMIDNIVMLTTPELPQQLEKLKLNNILYLDVPEKK